MKVLWKLALIICANLYKEIFPQGCGFKLTMRKVNKMITAIVYNGKKIKFGKKKIQHMVDNIDEYRCADNLPKWLYVSTGCKKSSRQIRKLIKDLNKLNATVDVRDQYSLDGKKRA